MVFLPPFGNGIIFIIYVLIFSQYSFLQFGIASLGTDRSFKVYSEGSLSCFLVLAGKLLVDVDGGRKCSELVEPFSVSPNENRKEPTPFEVDPLVIPRITWKLQ